MRGRSPGQWFNGGGLQEAQTSTWTDLHTSTATVWLLYKLASTSLVQFDERLDWNSNTDTLCRKGQSCLYFLIKVVSFNICEKKCCRCSTCGLWWRASSCMVLRHHQTTFNWLNWGGKWALSWAQSWTAWQLWQKENTEQASVHSVHHRRSTDSTAQQHLEAEELPGSTDILRKFLLPHPGRELPLYLFILSEEINHIQ